MHHTSSFLTHIPTSNPQSSFVDPLANIIHVTAESSTGIHAAPNMQLEEISRRFTRYLFTSRYLETYLVSA
ncbi:predicted protein [Sclerotinia sclerotiorum 1980 UF-70]|uniref:Uncharacterized protein n=1 Tax=Sclerotinia sclerotiorum (strain ATCC 18683 / 1980 / Ss-1) TaxID=665079 RepID=A7EB25_SCLS1|nr:predicted protein [Sclerotinia sclerotiorum 1980 UF-70]EDN99653.1 predicted protein [Sclerotinia sclerotiorum 1980 UF-70]